MSYFLGFFAFFWTACVSAKPLDIVDLQLRWHHQFQFAGYYAAVEKGFYSEEGLEVRLHAGDPDHQPVPEVLAGHAQYAEGNSEVLYQRLQGKPLIALAAIFQHSPSVLLTRKDSGIYSVHDLLGKKVMLMNMTEDADFLTMFLSEGVPLSQVDVIPSSYNLEDLISGKVAAFNSYTTNEPYFLQQRNIPYNVIDPKSYRIDFYSDILFTSETELRDHPKRVEALRRATLKGWRYAMDHQDEIIDLLINKYHVQKSRDHLVFEASEMRKLIFPDLIEIGHMNPGRWQHMADTFVKAGLIEPNYSLDGFIYDTTPKRLPEWVLPVLVTVLIVLAAISFVAYYLLRLNANLKKAKSRLQLAANVFSHAREGIFITDASGNIIDLNDAFSHITGYTREEVLGQNPRMFKSGRHTPEYYAAMWKALQEDGYWSGELWNRRKDGEVYAEMRTISAVCDATGKIQNYVALFNDITTMKNHQAQLEHIAHYDALTKLPNRVLLADRLQLTMIQSDRRKQSLAVAYLDLDGFKTVNDAYGHEIGDELLIAVSQRMKDALREGDTLARIGGDEFVAVLVDMGQMSDCELVLSRLLHAAADPVVVSNLVLQVSASIGVTLYPRDGADADLLMRHADQAMYIAKQAGKNRYHLFDVDQEAAVKTQLDGLEFIRRGIDNNEFVLYYQPKVNMKSGKVVGVEALIRWLHPERGLLPPTDFLPLIENHPISVELGSWVIRTALTQMSDWHAVGLDMTVSVNVCARQLQDDHFVTDLSALLAAYPDVKPCYLELEVLETNALEDMTKVSEIMHACRDIGMRFALDDFGTGYSSLTYLRRLPADILKIDRSFVRDMLDDPDDLAIVNGIIGLAGAFRRQVIAEGVETIAHGAQLLPLGCELAQGYGIAQPMPAAEIPHWVANWQQNANWTA